MARKPMTLDTALGHQASDKRLDILRRIATAGSISEAARSAGVSYKAAWQALETLGNLAGAPVVQKVVGGPGGGGARVTVEGEKLLRASDELRAARRAVLNKLEQGDATSAVAALGLRTSMRNQLPCIVASQKRDGGSVRVGLKLADGSTLYSRITRESAELLELAPGTQVLALCKATAVTVGSGLEARAAFNLLAGTVARASARSQEVAVHIGAGLQLTGFATADHGLRNGQAAAALVEEAAIVIAIPV